MTDNEIINGYFNWLVKLVVGTRFGKGISFNKLLMRLHSTEFIFTMPMDANRASDGVNLRWRYANFKSGNNLRLRDDIVVTLEGPCSVLEMMVALAIRCEVDIMDDPTIGDRTGQWFWGMVNNLGLGSMRDDTFDKAYVDECIGRFLDRAYFPDGRGGLFTIRNCDRDLRDVEIWYQLCWYLDSIT